MLSFAPWSLTQVAALAAIQAAPTRHPYTCGENSNHKPLIPTQDGWVCSDCDYTQNWAHKEDANA